MSCVARQHQHAQSYLHWDHDDALCTAHFTLWMQFLLPLESNPQLMYLAPWLSPQSRVGP